MGGQVAMKKWLIYMLFLLLPLACVRELEQVRPETELQPEGKVNLTFTVSGLPVVPATKSLGDDAIQDMYVAVFGRNKFLKEYVKATNLRRESDYLYPIVDDAGNPVYDGEGNPETIAVPQYSFNVALSMSDNERTLHFLGNGPQFLSYGSATATLPYILSDEAKNDGQAYWQMMTVDHIGALKNEAGDGYVISQGGDGTSFEPDNETRQALSVIPMVRNFAKIILGAEPKETSHFVPKSFALYNYPKRGTFVPFNSTTNSFIESYHTKDYNALHSAPLRYPGNFVLEDDLFDDSIPEADEFKDRERAAAAGNRIIFLDDEDAAAYMFERSVPTPSAPPTALLVYGDFYEEDQNGNLVYQDSYFYRIDLMEKVQEDNKLVFKYYPIYRNIQYEVIIGKIHSIGHSTPKAAAFSTGSADVSTSVSTQHLNDISDGTSRLVVMPWLAHTFTHQITEEDDFRELQAVYFSNMFASYDGGENIVSVELLPMTDGSPNIIENLRIDPVPEENMQGYRVIHFTTIPPQQVSHSQTIRVNAGTLHRDVVITLQNQQAMHLACTPELVTPENNQIVLSITIPDGLAESMFPLDFIIEPENMTLTPDVSKENNNLPVTSGASIKAVEEGVAKKQAFHFTRTITLEEYKKLPVRTENDGTWRTVACYFLPTRDKNATTIWVNEANGFFVPESISFRNKNHFDNIRFTDEAFENAIRIPRHGDAYVHFEVSKNPEWPVIQLETTGMTIDPEDNRFTKVREGVYTFHPDDDDAGIVNIHCITDADDGNISLRLSAEEDGYESALLKPKHFTYAHFVEGTNMVSGHINTADGKNVKFGYCDDPDDPYNPNHFASINFDGLTVNGVKVLTPSTSSSFPWRPNSRMNNDDGPSYHEFEFKTIAAYTGPVELTLYAPGYVDEPVPFKGRFNGDIINWNSGTVISKSNILKRENNVGFSIEHPEFDFRVGNDNSKYTDSHVSFNRISRLNNDGVWLEKTDDNTPYELTITCNNPSTDKLFYVAITFAAKHHPAEVNPGAEGSTFEPYKGAADNQFVWTLPENQYSGTLQMIPSVSDIVIEKIVIRTFRGSYTYYP